MYRDCEGARNCWVLKKKSSKAKQSKTKESSDKGPLGKNKMQATIRISTKPRLLL